MRVHSTARAWRVGLVAALMTAGVLGATPRAPALASGCSGTGCDNTDPVATGCALNQTALTSKPILNKNGGQVGLVTVYYSNFCTTKYAATDNRIIGGATYIAADVFLNDGRGSGDSTTSGTVARVYSHQFFSPRAVDCSGRGTAWAQGFVNDSTGINSATTSKVC